MPRVFVFQIFHKLKQQRSYFAADTTSDLLFQQHLLMMNEMFSWSINFKVLMGRLVVCPHSDYFSFFLTEGVALFCLVHGFLTLSVVLLDGEAA